MLRILIDTSVWLDLVKDYRNLPVISALEDIVHQMGVELIVPQVVLDEFERNRERVAADAKRSLHAHFSLVREAVWRFGKAKTKGVIVKALDEADHAAVYKGEAVNESIDKVEDLLRSADPLPATDGIKARAAERAMTGAAPFHRAKNSIGDAIIIETYADQMRSEERAEAAFAFVIVRDLKIESAGLWIRRSVVRAHPTVPSILY